MKQNSVRQKRKKRYRRNNRFQNLCKGIISICLIFILCNIGYALYYNLCPMSSANEELEAKVNQIAEYYSGQSREESTLINSVEKIEEIKEIESNTILAIIDKLPMEKSNESEEYVNQSASTEETSISDDIEMTEWENERRELMNNISLKPQYPNNQDLLNVLDRLMPQITENCEDTYDKVRACYTYLIENCTYSQTIKYDYEYDAYLLLTEMKGSCTYYAAAFHYMMLYIGLDDKIINGYRNLESGKSFHRWNEICINNMPYIFDTQWEDTLSRRSELRYVRFFKTYQELQGLYQMG